MASTVRGRYVAIERESAINRQANLGQSQGDSFHRVVDETENLAST